MRINPVSIYQSAGINNIQIKNKNTSSAQNFSSNGKKSSVVYPRRYLPDYYPQSPEINKRTYDSFTGMRDKNFLLAVVNRTMTDISTNPKKEFSIAMFDMDNFKSVNELLGYQTGDDFIKVISKRISDTAKSNGIYAYRFGGEEFVIVFDKQTKEKQKEIVSKIINDINEDDYIHSKEDEYRLNAHAKLEQYNRMHDKVNNLITMKTKQSLLRELKTNFATEEAKNDAYLAKVMTETDANVKNLYLELINEQLSSEDADKETRAHFESMKKKIEDNSELTKSESDELDESLLSVYDRTFEIHQIKKWLNDMDRNGGFSITGGVVCFNKHSLENLTALDVVNEAGEVLKNGKFTQKGKSYYHNFS